MINAAMQAERSEHLQAAPYEHNPERRGYANGYKPKTMRTRVGDITFAVPQVREAGFYPPASDDHAGLRAARLAVFGGIRWQRCQFHLQQNAQAYVPREDMLTEVAADIRTTFEAPDRAAAEAYLAKTVEKYSKSASRLSEWLAVNIPDGLTSLLFQLPPGVCCEPPMASNASIAKSGAEHGSFRSFPILPALSGGEVQIRPLVINRILDIVPVSGWQMIQQANSGLMVLLAGARWLDR